MIIKETLYALGDITIVPDVQSDIRHRSECNIFYSNGKLPIFTAPMNMVVSKNNMDIWTQNYINPIMPRTEDFKTREEWYNKGYWIAVSLEEFDTYFCNIEGKYDYLYNTNTVKHVLIDIANGHMSVLCDYIKKGKKLASKFGCNLQIMVGNIANPLTYKCLAEAGADYIRVGIGGGGCCITSSNTSCHYSMASLIDDCRAIKNKYGFECAIIADGGINSFANIIKALACGADYVMMGSLLASCFESAGYIISEVDNTFIDKHNEHLFTTIFSEEQKKDIIKIYHPMKTIYGMSSRKAQIAINPNAKLKTSEGIEKPVEVKYTVKQWVDNFMSYLKSAMSYTNKRNITDFIGGVTIMLLSESSKLAINK